MQAENGNGRASAESVLFVQRATCDELETVLRFLEGRPLRDYYTGWIAELRAELERRRKAALDSEPL